MSATVSTPPAAKPLTKNEQLKIAIPTLAGNIAATLSNPELDAFSADDEQFLKFHGIYQQDDRDKRKVAKQYIMMVRGRIPGGIMTPNEAREYLNMPKVEGGDNLLSTNTQAISSTNVPIGTKVAKVEPLPGSSPQDTGGGGGGQTRKMNIGKT